MKRLSDKSVRSNCSTEEDAPSAMKGDPRPARPKNYISPFRQVLSRAARDGVQKVVVVPYGRVSSPKQRRDGSLDHQVNGVRKCVSELADHYKVQVEICDV